MTKEKKMPKIVQIADEGQSQDLNTGDPNPNADFLPLSQYWDVSTVYLSHFNVYASKGNATTDHSYKPGVSSKKATVQSVKYSCQRIKY